MRTASGTTTPLSTISGIAIGEPSPGSSSIPHPTQVFRGSRIDYNGHVVVFPDNGNGNSTTNSNGGSTMPTYSATTNALDLWRVLALAGGIAIGWMMFRK